MNFENFSNSEVRAYARERLKGNWLNGALFALILFFIGGIVSSITALLLRFSLYSYFVNLAAYILMLPFAVSLVYVFLKFSRGDALEYQGLTYGYSKGMFEKSIALMFMTGLFTFLWSLLFIIPGIIKAVSYSLAPYVLVDNPNFGWKECLNASKNLTNGYKGQLFLLLLSFLGWAILCLFTLGIGYLFLYPYIQTSMANFYDRRRISVYGIPEYEQEEPIFKW